MEALVTPDDRPRTRAVVVLGGGARFDRRFAEALRLGGFERRSQVADIPDAPVIVSWLDGDPKLEPGDVDSSWIVIGGPPAGGPVLPTEASAEALLFFVARALPAVHDLRRDRRVLAPLVVRYRRRLDSSQASDEPVRQGELLDVSRGGAYVRSLMPPRTGERLHLEVAAGPHGSLELDGVVVRSLRVDLERGIVYDDSRPGVPVPSHPGFGIIFEAPGEAALIRLDVLVTLLSGSPAP
jgi:hypothetical protein